MTNAQQVFSIHGGVHPPENKTQSTGEPIGTIPLAAEIVLPLSQHLGAPAMPVVAIGDQVLKGQLIAAPQGLISAPVHASTSGKVIAIENHPIPHASGINAPCIVIETDHNDTWIELTPCEDYTQLGKDNLLQIIRDSGITGMGGAGFPTAVKLNPRADQHIDTLIINGTECEPYITADDMLMREKADEIVAGALLLSHLLGNPENVYIGIEDNKPEAIAAMQAAVQGSVIRVIEFPTKYPSGGEKQLIEILTGKQVPSGGLPAQIGIVVQNVGTARAAWRAVRFGEPLISRVTTVVGESLRQQRNIDVPLGTPIVHILKSHGWNPDACARLIIGGPMMGFTVENALAPVIKTSNCILAPSYAEMPPPPPAQACIRCGMCAQACPASLLPQQLFWYAQSEDFEKLRVHNLFDCIECGACSFVCPSNIPLVQYYRASKGEIRKLDLEKQKSDRSRLRFENRKARIAEAESEKEAKRLARREAAEAAKKATAVKPNVSQTSELLTAAVNAASSQSVDPEKELAKLERALSSAHSRVERANKQLAESQQQGEAPERLAALAARLKQAQQKALEAQKKLDNFSQSQLNVVATAQSVAEKLQASPKEQLEQAIASLRKRLETAKQKHAEAQEQHSPSTDALKLGVEKLEEKLNTNLEQLASLAQNQSTAAPSNHQVNDAAQAAIERAKASAAAKANMSPEEKQLAQLKSLEARLAKAKLRFQKAQQENDENLDAFANSVAKLEEKLKEAQDATTGVN